MLSTAEIDIIWIRYLLLIVISQNFLYNYGINEVKSVINSARACRRKLSILESTLYRFEGESDFEIIKEDLVYQVQEIENEEGYKAFSYFFGINYEEDQKNNSEAITSNVPPLLVVIENIPDNALPSLPWFESNVNRYLYTEVKEKEYLKLTPEVRDMKIEPQNLDFFKRIRLNEIHEAVIKKMQDRNFSVRAFEIFSLYVSILIANDLGLEISTNDMEANFNDDYKFETFPHVKKLFNSYYEKIKNNIQNQKIIPIALGPQDDLWIELLEEIRLVGEKMKLLKKQYADKFVQLKSLNTIQTLCYEIKEFLFLHFAGTSEIPTMREIQKKDKGPSLVKKIQAGDGGEKKGIEVIKDAYKIFLKDQQIKSDIFKKNHDYNPSFDVQGRLYQEVFENQIFSTISKLIRESSFSSNQWELIREPKNNFDLHLKNLESEEEILILIKAKLDEVSFKGLYSIFFDFKSLKRRKFIIISKFNPKIQSEKKFIKEKVFYLSQKSGVEIEAISIIEIEQFFQKLFNPKED